MGSSRQKHMALRMRRRRESVNNSVLEVDADAIEKELERTILDV